MSDLAHIRDLIKERLRLSDIVGRKVRFDRRKSQPARGDFWACCPFHSEKTPSFHVLDREGFYKCFSCGAGGDAITFVMETENREFWETLEMLAGEAGVALPERRPGASEEARAARSLHDLLEAAAKFFQGELARAGGAEARAYLARRGLAPAIIERFRLGYAPKGGRATIEHLTQGGATIAELRAAGLLTQREEPRDLFVNRLIFPITDGRGRVIAFGGRDLAPDPQIKYLNSPETALFMKGRSLYNFAAARARVPAGRDGAVAPEASLVIAEGYMDVIALHEAGFTRVVAPLGTALTEDQLRLVWSVADMPILCLDGDAAGEAAAMRALERALPLLKPGKSLRLARLPAGSDPDDLLRKEGTGALREIIASAIPLAEALYQFAVKGARLDEPDERARVEAELRREFGRITEPGLRAHYDAFLRDKVFGWRRMTQRPSGPDARNTRPPMGGAWRTPSAPLEIRPTAELASRLKAKTSAGGHGEEMLLLAFLLNLTLVGPYAERLGRLALHAKGLAPLRDALVAFAAEGGEGEAALRAVLARHGAEAEARRLKGNLALRCTPATKDGGGAAAEAAIAEMLARLEAREAGQQAREDIRSALAEGITEESLSRVATIRRIARPE